jgi:hypothetical protein
MSYLPIEEHYIEFEGLTAVVLKSSIFWDILLCSLRTTRHYIPKDSTLRNRSLLLKGKVVPSTMPWRHMGEWRYSSTILDLGTRWRWVVSFMPQPLSVGEIAPQYPLDRGPQNWSGRCAAEKNLFPPSQESNPGLPACSPPLSTELSQIPNLYLLITRGNIVCPIRHAYQAHEVYLCN